MDDRFTLRTEWEAIFSLSSINGGANGVIAHLNVRNRWGIYLQFDDSSWEWVSDHTSHSIKCILHNRVRLRWDEFDAVPDGEVVWRPDDRCYNHVARGFMALQKRIHGRTMELICMMMKKDYDRDEKDETLAFPAATFVPEGQTPEQTDIPPIFVSPKEWESLSYLIVQMWRESSWKTSQKMMLPSFEKALGDSEKYFRTTLLPENVTRIKSVFGI